jgi:hypothetical protein
MYHFLLLANDCLEEFEFSLEESEVLNVILESDVLDGRFFYDSRVGTELGWRI